MQTVYVTNRWVKPIEFSFEYKPYCFPVGETVEAPLEAVRHIFGHGEPDKVPFMSRLSLIQTQKDIPEGLKILQKFEITDEPPKKDHLLSPVVERVPLPSKVGGKLKESTPNG
jgi:hypothetical protein